MKKFEKVLASCLASCLLFNAVPVDAHAEVRVSFIDDFNNGEGGYEQPVVTVPVATEAPVYTETPTQPVYTQAPQNTTNPFSFNTGTLPPEPTEEPSNEPAPTFSLERPNVSYYCYYDKMEFEKSHLGMNITKYDEKRGAVKERNAKIPVRKVKYSKGGITTIKAKYGTCFRIVPKGVKKYKYVGHSDRVASQIALHSWETIRSTQDKKNYKCVLVNFKETRTFGFKVNGKVFRVRVKPYGSITAKASSTYEGKGYKSKYTWKTMMRNVISGGEQVNVPNYVVARNREDYGRSKYCSWDKNYFYVQGGRMKKPHKNISSAYVGSLTFLAAEVDNIIEQYHIPSSTKMSQEQCCKWIRRNGKLLRSIFAITKSQGTDPTSLAYALYPIFNKAYKYSLSDKYSANGLVFYHIYDKKPSAKYYTWLKFYALPADIGYYDTESEEYVEIWGLPTWVGEIFGAVKGIVER